MQTILDGKRLLFFIILPSAANLILLFFYFSGNEALQSIIAPSLTEYNWNVGREMGLLENIQNIILLFGITISLRSVLKESILSHKLLLLIIFLALCVLFLEEIDYGLHYYEFLSGITAESSKNVRNLHNIGNRSDFLWIAGDTFFFLFFAVMPFLRVFRNNRIYILLSPDKWYALLFVLGWIFNLTGIILFKHGFAGNDPLRDNMGEFLEITYYYMFVLYIYDHFYHSRKDKTIFPTQYVRP